MLDTLLNLYLTEKKPLTPLDLSLLTYLVLRQTEDHFIYDSHDTLAARLGCERKSIARSIQRLEKLKWVTVQRRKEFNPVTKRRGIDKTAGLSVNLAKLPQLEDRAKRSAPASAAKELAAQYVFALRQRGRTKLAKNFQTQQEYAAQRFLDELQQDADALFALVNFAFKDPTFREAAQHSLYRLWLRRRTLIPAFKMFQKEQAA